MSKQHETTRLAWEKYLTAWEDGFIARDLRLAQQMSTQLSILGEQTETVYAQIERPPPRELIQQTTAEAAQRATSLNWLLSRNVGVPPPPPGYVSLGHDVSTATPSFHSVILEPGLVAEARSLADHLNEFGLIDDLEFAANLMSDANATGYLLGMFAVIRILGEK